MAIPKSSIFFLTLFFSIGAACTFSKKESGQGRVNNQPPSDFRETSVHDTAQFRALFQIPVETFFQGDALAMISAGRQHESSLYVPLTFAVRNETFFIPNLDKREIWHYSRNGRKIGVRPFPDSLESLDFFDFLNDSTIVGSSFLNGIICEINDRNEIVKQYQSQDVKFSVDGDNYLFRFVNRFQDRQGLFPNDFHFEYPYSSFDYHLSDRVFFVASFAGDSLVLSRNDIDGITNTVSISGLDLKNSSKPNILDFKNNVLTVLVDPVLGRRTPLKLIQYDFNRGRYTVKFLKNPANEAPLIGEGAALWGAGMVYTFENDRLYVLYTSSDAIKLFYFDLS